jgi:hypothetical protein
MRKVLVIGLDCVDPYLVFNKFFEELSNIQKLTRIGKYYDPREDLGGFKEDKDILELAPTMLEALGYDIQEYMRGKPIQR